MGMPRLSSCEELTGAGTFSPSLASFCLSGCFSKPQLVVLRHASTTVSKEFT